MSDRSKVIILYVDFTSRGKGVNKSGTSEADIPLKSIGNRLASGGLSTTDLFSKPNIFKNYCDLYKLCHLR